MPSTYNQFVAYGTDIVGLERILRGIQSLLIITTSYPVLAARLTSLLAPFLLTPPPTSLALLPALALLASRVNLVRRTLRAFRFLEWFAAGLALLTDAPAAGLETWVGVAGKTALGMYGLLETATLLDVADLPGLRFLSAERCRALNAQAQVWWFVALLAGVLGAGWRAVKLWAWKPAEGVAVSVPGGAVGEGVAGEGEEEKEAVRDARRASKAAARRAEAERRGQMRGLGVQMATDLMDMTLPAAAVGWIEVESGVSGSVMLLTTLVTGWGVWKRMGREMAAREAS